MRDPAEPVPRTTVRRIWLAVATAALMASTLPSAEAQTPEKVWRVLTERDLLKQWFPCDVDGEWKVGSKLRFHFLHGEGDGLPDEELRGEALTMANTDTNLV